MHNLSLATIDCCDELYLIATPDVPALRDLSRYIDRLLQSNVPPDKIKVVINRFSSQGALTPGADREGDPAAHRDHHSQRFRRPDRAP